MRAAGTFRCAGRILYLTRDPDAITRQMAGEDLRWPIEGELRDDISTDEITPVHTMYQFDRRLGDHAYVGFETGGVRPFQPNSTRAGGFTVSVSGSRRGRGSSREHAPYAERCAGIRLIVAESFEHTYRRNCEDQGILTTTDFSILERLQRGEEIPIAEFAKEADEIGRQVVERGGLLSFSKARLAGKASVPRLRAASRPMTLGEKILTAHMVVDASTDEVGVHAVAPGDAGFVRADLRVSHEYITPMAASVFAAAVGPSGRVRDPDSVLMFRDHLTFLDEVMPPQRRALGLLGDARRLVVIQERFAAEQGIRLHGELEDRKGSLAISHNLLLEEHAQPGQVIASADSHAPHVGAVGCLGIGIGTTALANAWITKDVRIVVPPSVKIFLAEPLAAGVAAKDVVLHLLRLPEVRAGSLAGRMVEYAGPGIRALGIDERATLTNMAAELGALTALVEPDARTRAWLARRRSVPRGQVEESCALRADPQARYERVIEVASSAVAPMVALPGDPGNGVAVDALDAPPDIDIAFAGSCTGSKAADMDMLARVLGQSLRDGRTVHPRVRFYVQLGSQAVKEHCRRRGHLDTFERAGVRVLEPACGACCNAGPGVSESADQVTVSSMNRNYAGRSGPGKVFLASPYTVAASAVAGRIARFEADAGRRP